MKNRILITSSLFLLTLSLGAAADRRPVLSSFYGPEGYHGRQTASGERYDMYAPTVAHRTLPFGTLLEITNDAVSRSIIARTNDRGPFVPGRDLDISYGCAYLLGTVDAGVAKLTIREIEQEEISWAILKMNEETARLRLLFLEQKYKTLEKTLEEKMMAWKAAIGLYLIYRDQIRSLTTTPASKKGKAGRGY